MQSLLKFELFVQPGNDCRIKNAFQILLCQRRTLDVLFCAYFASHLLSLLSCDRTEILTAQTGDLVEVAASVDLCADENYRSLSFVVLEFHQPIVPDSGKCSRVADIKAKQKHFRVRVAESSEESEFGLSSSVDELDRSLPSIDSKSNCVVIVDGRLVFRRVVVVTVRNEHIRFASSLVADHDDIHLLQIIG